MKDYLSVKEFAAAANISQQYVYKIIKKQLQPYVVMVEGKTKIRQEGLKVVKPVEQPVSQPVEQPVPCSDLAEKNFF